MKVRDVMTKNPVTISPDDTVGYAWSIIKKNSIWSLPVIHKEKIVGMVTKQDLSSKSENNKQKISEIMSKNPLTISPDEDLSTALDIIVKARINALIVNKDNASVGIITRKDIYKKFRPKTDVCSYCYPRGDRKKKEVFRCEHCNEYFCEEHLYSKIPQTAPFKSTDIDRHIEWDKKGGHPCFPYFEYIINKEKDKKNRNASTVKISPMITNVTEPEMPEAEKPKKVKEKPAETPRPIVEKPEKTIDDKIYETAKEHKPEKPIKIMPGTEPQKVDLQKTKKHICEKYYYSFKRWFFRKSHPRSKLRYEQFVVHLTVLICSFFLFWMIYSNIEQLNNLVLIFIKLGSLILLILLVAIILAVYRLLKNLKYGIRGLHNGYKSILSVVLILYCLHLFLNPNIVANSLTSFNYDTLNPFEINIDFTGSDTIDESNGIYNSDNNDINDDNNDVKEDNNPKPEIDIAALELEIHNLINNERQSHGLSSLQLDSKLSNIARAHSEDMAINDYFSHYNLVGQGPTERAAAAGYPTTKNVGNLIYTGIGENIHKGWLYSQITYGWTTTYDWYTQSEIAYNAVNGWMNSPGHRENILTSTYDKEGIGIAISDDYAVYATQDFW